MPVLGVAGRKVFKKNIYDHLKFIARDYDEDDNRVSGLGVML